MFDAVIFDESNGKIHKSYKTFRGAKVAFKRTGLENNPNMTVCTLEQYLKTGAIKANEMVEVYSIFDQKKERPIKIRRADVGGACDPSTERYHTM